MARPLGYEWRMGKPMQQLPRRYNPMTATQAVTNYADKQPSALQQGLGAAGSAVTGNPLGAALTLGQGAFNVVGDVAKRNKFRDLKDEARDRARQGSPAAKARLGAGQRQIAAGNKYALQRASADLSRTGGPGMALARTNLQGRTNQAIADLQGSVGAEDAQYRQQARNEAAQYRAMEGEAAGNIARSVGGAFGLAGQFLGDEAAKAQEQQRYQTQLGLQQERLALAQAAEQNQQQRFEQGQDLRRELAGDVMDRFQTTEERLREQFDRRMGAQEAQTLTQSIEADRERLDALRENQLNRMQRRDELAFRADLSRQAMEDEYDQRKELEAVKAGLKTQEGRSLGGDLTTSQQINVLEDENGNYAPAAALDAAYRSGDQVRIRTTRQAYEGRSGVDLTKVENDLMKAASPDATGKDVALALMHLAAINNEIKRLDPNYRDAAIYVRDVLSGKQATEQAATDVTAATQQGVPGAPGSGLAARELTRIFGVRGQ